MFGGGIGSGDLPGGAGGRIQYPESGEAVGPAVDHRVASEGVDPLEPGSRSMGEDRLPLVAGGGAGADEGRPPQGEVLRSVVVRGHPQPIGVVGDAVLHTVLSGRDEHRGIERSLGVEEPGLGGDGTTAADHGHGTGAGALHGHVEALVGFVEHLEVVSGPGAEGVAQDPMRS